MKPHKRPVPRIIAIASGKGGVGKSTIALTLALALGRLGHRVTLVDADLGAANLHTMVGMLRPKASLAEFFDGDLGRIDDAAVSLSPTLTLIPGTSRPGAANLSAIAKAALLRGVARLDCDCVVLDIGAGTSFTVVDLVAFADHKLFVMSPQLPSIHNAYALLKACVHRVVSKLATDDTGQAMIDAALANESKARSIRQLVEVLRQLDPSLAMGIEQCVAGFGVGLIGNHLTDDSQLAAFTRISTMFRDQLGIHAPVVAAVRRTPSLAGGLRTGVAHALHRTDPAVAAFHRLAVALLDIDLVGLRGAARVTRMRTLPLWIERALDPAV